MSGGSFDYLFYRVEDSYVGNMNDIDLNEMMKDLIKVLHDLEWYESGDIGEETYKETVNAFKGKWFNKKCKKCVLSEKLETVKKILNCEDLEEK